MLNRPIPRSLKLGILGLTVIVVIGTIPLLLTRVDSEPETITIVPGVRVGNYTLDESETITIVPGVRVGNYTLDMSKDDVLKKLGEPKVINYEGERYTLNNLPTSYIMHFDGISFWIRDDAIYNIIVYDPSYQLADGLGVGDPEEKIIQAFGNNFQLKQFERAKHYSLTYEDEGLEFEIRKKNRTVMKIIVKKKISRGHGDSLVKPIKSVKEFDGVRS